ncbi:MAG: NAD(P)-dependent glycerol-3-phosphate dehydrogenase [Deltaproteobacteria bacterium]|jgi:glycerol-3-phosphate dehydrogenase (NAD(P)+)|nr:NAD(P)-dependent glycerol-3-phosphate dehydrogenase [Deltaproteobacteria bacterium]
MAPSTPPASLGNGKAATAVVLGGGSWGTALAHLMAVAGVKVQLWMRSDDRVAEINEQHTNSRYLKDKKIHERVVATSDLRSAASFAETIIVAIPSANFRAVAFELGEVVSGDQILLSATKGFEAENLTRMSQILREETCCRKIGAISGPNLADEVMDNHPTATVIASPMEEVIEKAGLLLAGPTLRVYGNHDLVGVEVMGALKNIIAIAAGVCAGMGYGQNSLAMLLTRGLTEISRFGEALGADKLTALGLAGLGDLVATCASPLSRNNTLGRKLASGMTLTQAQADSIKVAEGVNTTFAATKHASRLGVDMPITRAVHALLFEEMKPIDVLTRLMSRANRYEHTEVPIDAPRMVDGSVVDTALSVAARARGW